MYIFIYIYIYGEKERLYICIHEWNICTHILKLQKRNQFWPPSMEVTFNSLPNLNEGWIGPLCGERLPHVDREASGSCGDRAGGVPKHISRWLLILFWRCGLCSFVYICIYIYIYLFMYVQYIQRYIPCSQDLDSHQFITSIDRIRSLLKLFGLKAFVQRSTEGCVNIEYIYILYTCVHKYIYILYRDILHNIYVHILHV